MSHNDGCILFFLNLNNLIAGSKPARENGSQYLLLMPRIIYSKYSMLLLYVLTFLLIVLGEINLRSPCISSSDLAGVYFCTTNSLLVERFYYFWLGAMNSLLQTIDQ